MSDDDLQSPPAFDRQARYQQNRGTVRRCISGNIRLAVICRSRRYLRSCWQAVLAATANRSIRDIRLSSSPACAEATTRTPEFIYHKDADGADVMIVPNGGKLKSFVAPARELVKEFNK